MPTGAKLDRKNAYMAKLVDLVENCALALIVCVDHVGSKQMQNIRLALRGNATVGELFMGERGRLLRWGMGGRVGGTGKGGVVEGRCRKPVIGNFGR